LALEEGGEGAEGDVGGSFSSSGILSYIVSQLAAVFNIIIENGSILVDNIFGKKIVAEEELCIEDICVDRDTLEALLLNAGLEPAGGSEEDTGTVTTSSSGNSNASSTDNTDIDSTASSTPSDDVA